ncbi:MAG: dihydrodipicolinate synthase family protein [bacterium]
MANKIFRPEGVYAAMLTPFDEKGKVNEPVLRNIVDFLIDKGIDGLYPVSSVGEFVHLSPEENMEIMDICIDQAKGRVPVVPGVSASCAEKSVILAKHAEKIGCKGVVACPPYYFAVSQEIVERHFEIIADAVNISVVLYNIPFTTTKISYDVVKRLSRRENVVALKDSSGSMVDIVHFMDKIRIIGEDLSLLLGREDIFFPGLMMGATGCMVASGCIVPEILKRLHKCFKQARYDEARELQFSILILLRAMWSLPMPIGFKLTMELRGFPMGPFKQPLSDAEQFIYLTTKSRIEKLFQPILERIEKMEKEEKAIA